MAEDDLNEAEDGSEDDLDEEGEGGGGPRKKKLGGKKLVLFIVLPILLLAGGGAAAYFTGMLDSVLGKTHEEGEGHEEEDVIAPVGQYVSFGPIRTNFRGDGGANDLVEINFRVEVVSDHDAAILEEYRERITDSIVRFLRELRLEDLQGSVAPNRLGEEIEYRIGIVAPSLEINGVYFDGESPILMDVK